MSRRLFWNLFLFLALLASRTASGEPALKATLAKDKISPSDSTLFQIQAEWPKEEGSYSFGIPDLPLDNLMLLREGTAQETFQKDGRDWVRKEFTFELTGRSPGAGKIKDFSIPYIDPSTQKGGRFQVAAMQVEIEKPPAHLFRWLAIAGAAAASAAIILKGLYPLEKRPPERLLNPPQISKRKKPKRCGRF